MLHWKQITSVEILSSVNPYYPVVSAVLIQTHFLHVLVHTIFHILVVLVGYTDDHPVAAATHNWHMTGTVGISGR